MTTRAILAGIALLLAAAPAAGQFAPGPNPDVEVVGPSRPRAASKAPATGTSAEAPPASACAGLAETGPVAQPGPDVIATPVPMGDRNLRCPDDFRLDLRGRLPRCLRPGIKIVDGSPRAACYAALPFGPLAPLADRSRPTRTCPRPRTTTIVRLTGANLGLGDVAINVVPDAGITLTTLTDSSAEAPETENPVLQGCFAFQCRLVKLEITARAAPVVELRAALPGRDYVATTLNLPEYCPR